MKFKTIKGLLEAFAKLEAHSYSDLKGFDNLTEEQKYSIGVITACIGNELGDFFPNYHKGMKKSINK